MSSATGTVPLDQYNALRQGYGFVELTNWSSVTLTGDDRQKFLNSFCTNDVQRLEPGEACEAFITSVKGKTLGHGLVSSRDEELVFITVPGQASTLIAHLERYIIREDVQLTDTTSERSYLLVAGGNGAGSGLAEGRWLHWRILQSPVCGLLETSPATIDRLKTALVGAGALPCDDAAFLAARVESGTPLYGADFDAESLPQEVGRDEQAISFTKGCYLGQETVARIDALGHVNQQLTGVRFADGELPASGVLLTRDGAAAGRIASATYSPGLGVPLAFAMVRRGWLVPNTRLDSEAGPCEVTELPIPW